MRLCSLGCTVVSMVGVAQLVERWLVEPDVAGSSPVVHPTNFALGFRVRGKVFSRIPWSALVSTVVRNSDRPSCLLTRSGTSVVHKGDSRP